jgi:hypothetical protein
MVAGVKDAQFFSFLGFIASPHIFEYICECRRDNKVLVVVSQLKKLWDEEGFLAPG